MFLSKLQLKNFKRFTDLTIDLERPDEQPPKLVLLIGANGCGKSSVFDAFEFLRTPWNIPSPIDDYYIKKGAQNYNVIVDGSKGEFTKSSEDLPAEPIIYQGKQITPDKFTRLQGVIEGYKFYGRTSFRYTSRIVKTTIGTTNVDISSDADRPETLIDIDTTRLSADIDQIFSDFLRQIMEKNNAQEKFNERFNTAFINIFGEGENSLRYASFDLPLEGKPVMFYFSKGYSKKLPYDLLSAGEKMVFELLLNLYARRSFFQDAIYFFDEIDLHLNTSIQASLLKEIVENWIPEGSQVWVASHSLGFIDYARSSETAAIIDFDNLDFDEVQLLKPKSADEFDVYNIVFGVSELTATFSEYLRKRDLKTFVCEGSDGDKLRRLNLKNFEFTDKFGKDKTNKKAVIQITQNEGIFGLIDRDYLTDEEAEILRQESERLRILDYYCFENYLYHPKNVSEFRVDDAAYLKTLSELKKRVLDELITKISQDRQTYKKLESQEVKIKKALESDDFETFYKFLNVNKIDKSSLVTEFSLPSEEQLAQTQWFKEQMEKVLR